MRSVSQKLSILSSSRTGATKFLSSPASKYHLHKWNQTNASVESVSGKLANSTSNPPAPLPPSSSFSESSSSESERLLTFHQNDFVWAAPPRRAWVKPQNLTPWEEECEWGEQKGGDWEGKSRPALILVICVIIKGSALIICVVCSAAK